MNKIFFDVMLPKLFAWSKNKDFETKKNVVNETFKEMIIFLEEKARIFFENPKKAESQTAHAAISCFMLIADNFYITLSSWHENHSQTPWPTSDLTYHYEKIFAILKKILHP